MPYKNHGTKRAYYKVKIITAFHASVPYRNLLLSLPFNAKSVFCIAFAWKRSSAAFQSRPCIFRCAVFLLIKKSNGFNSPLLLFFYLRFTNYLKYTLNLPGRWESFCWEEQAGRLLVPLNTVYQSLWACLTASQNSYDISYRATHYPALRP